MIEIEIDGQALNVEPGSMVIEAADAAGIAIPRFCYHKKLSIAANCRMCLVEVEKVGKPLPACATPVTDGMKIYTRSPKAIDAQRSVMEFLLINHPLDCPICDQGGQCELQDVSMGYGQDLSRYTEGKRVVADEDIGPLVATDMTRCIHCTRCVRFGEEIAGIRELGGTGRGERTRIGTYIKHSLTSELSGNIIDLCPVGALTSKPFRYKARAWELTQHASIAPHDCLGSNIYMHSRNQEVMRVVPKENEAINETWLSDRDRFSYLGLTSEDRLHKPLLKRDGAWIEVDWQTALHACAEGLQKIKQQHGADQLAAIISPSATLEEAYLLQNVIRDFGSPHIDHRLRATDVADQFVQPAYPGLSIPLADIETRDAIMLIGSNIQKQQPLAGLRVRKAALAGAQVFALNCIDYDFNFPLADKLIAAPNALVWHLAGIVKALENTSKLPTEVQKLLQDVNVSAAEQAIAQALVQAKQPLILLGDLALHHPYAATLRMLANLLAELCNASVGTLTEGANSAGAWLAGAIPHRTAGNQAIEKPGLAAMAAFAAQLKAYLLYDVEPELDSANPELAVQALAQAEFVVSLSPFKSTAVLQHAQVILPIAAFSEKAGTYINVNGQLQSFMAAVNPPGEVRPGWKVLRVLGNLLDIPGFDYETIEQVYEEIKTVISTMPTIAKAAWYPDSLPVVNNSTLTRITEWPMVASDSIVRRAQALQLSPNAIQAGVYLQTNTAQALGLQPGNVVQVKQGNGQVQLPVFIDNRIPEQCVFIPAGLPEASHLGAAFGTVHIEVMAHA